MSSYHIIAIFISYLAFCISGYLCVLLITVWWSETCKCDKYKNKKPTKESGRVQILLHCTLCLTAFHCVSVCYGWLLMLNEVSQWTVTRLINLSDIYCMRSSRTIPVFLLPDASRQGPAGNVCYSWVWCLGCA